MLEILRSHHPQFDEGRRFQKNSVASVCMHGGGLVGDHTTGSYVASLGEVIDTYWITAASTPCIAVFKPYWLTDNEVVFSEEQEAEALAFWKLREELHRLVLHNRVDVDAYLRQAKDLEREYLRRTTALDLGNADPNQLNELMRWAWQQEKELVEKTVAQSRSNAGKIKEISISAATGRSRRKSCWEARTPTACIQRCHLNRKVPPHLDAVRPHFAWVFPL